MKLEGLTKLLVRGVSPLLMVVEVGAVTLLALLIRRRPTLLRLVTLGVILKFFPAVT